MTTNSIGSPLPETICFIWNYLKWGGAQMYFLSILRNAPQGQRFEIYVPAGAGEDIQRFFDGYGAEFNYLKYSSDLEPKRSVVAKLVQHFRRLRSEFEIIKATRKIRRKGAVVHIETAPWQSWILLFFLSRNVGVFATAHNAMPPDPPVWRRLIWRCRLRFLLRRGRFHLFAANEHARQSLLEIAGSDLESKISLTRVGINLSEIDQALAAKRDDTVADEPIRVLTVGQFIDRKGRWELLAAAKQVLGQNRRVQFIWIGPQMPDKNEAARIESYELGGSFRYVPSSDAGKTRLELLAYFAQADIFVLPSLWEGLPISILEAMALGLPVISTRLNAIPEAIVDGETGILVAPGDVKALARSIIELVDDPNLRLDLGMNARRHVRDHFDERDLAITVFDHYRAAGDRHD